MIVVFDSNLWIAAALESLYALNLANLGAKGTITIAVSPPILAEIKEKLSEKFHWQKADINDFLDYIDRVSVRLEPAVKTDVIKQDKDDNRVIECAIAAQASLIVTSDKHLLKLKKYQNIGIVHPRTFGWIFPTGK